MAAISSQIHDPVDWMQMSGVELQRPGQSCIHQLNERPGFCRGWRNCIQRSMLPARLRRAGESIINIDDFNNFDPLTHRSTGPVFDFFPSLRFRFSLVSLSLSLALLVSIISPDFLFSFFWLSSSTLPLLLLSSSPLLASTLHESMPPLAMDFSHFPK